jgi:hypothetical protein
VYKSAIEHSTWEVVGMTAKILRMHNGVSSTLEE